MIGQLSHGGAERQCLELAKGLRDGGVFTPIVFCTSAHTEPYGDLLTKCGIEWYLAPKNCRRGISKLWWLIRYVRRHNCRSIYGVLHSGNAYGGFAARLLRIPFVASIRSATRQRFPVRLASSLACRRAVTVVANSASANASLEADMGVRHTHVAIIPNSVRQIERSSESRDEIRLQVGIPADALVVGTIGNLKAEKRANFFLAVCDRLHALWQQPSVSTAFPHFIWLGEGTGRAAVTTALAQRPADLRDHIHFPGASMDVDGYLSAFDAFVLTSAYEGMPNALLEAMAAGLPCVATDVPGTCDVLNAAADIGILADAQDPDKFAEQLIALLADLNRMRLLGDNGRNHVREHHSMDQMIKAYTVVFLEALERQGRT